MLYVLTIKIRLRNSFSLYATIEEFGENQTPFYFPKKFPWPFYENWHHLYENVVKTTYTDSFYDYNKEK